MTLVHVCIRGHALLHTSRWARAFETNAVRLLWRISTEGFGRRRSHVVRGWLVLGAERNRAERKKQANTHREGERNRVRETEGLAGPDLDVRRSMNTERKNVLVLVSSPGICAHAPFGISRMSVFLQVCHVVTLTVAPLRVGEFSRRPYFGAPVFSIRSPCWSQPPAAPSHGRHHSAPACSFACLSL